MSLAGEVRGESVERGDEPVDAAPRPLCLVGRQHRAQRVHAGVPPRDRASGIGNAVAVVLLPALLGPLRTTIRPASTTGNVPFGLHVMERGAPLRARDRRRRHLRQPSENRLPARCARSPKTSTYPSERPRASWSFGGIAARRRGADARRRHAARAALRPDEARGPRHVRPEDGG